MKYKISEVARLLDITPELIRYYESKGIISPERSEGSGYRYYGGWDLHMLIRARIYRRFGYSLDDVAKLINDYNTSDLIMNLANQEELVEKEISWHTNLLKYIRSEKQSIITCCEQMGKYRVEIRPEIYRLETQDGYILYPDKNIHHIICNWMNNIPFVFSSTLFSLEEVNKKGKNFSVGLGICSEYADLLDFNIRNSKYVRLFPAEECIHTGIQTKSNTDITPELLIPALQYMDDHGMVLTGDVICKSAFMNKVNGEYINWHEIWLPFKKKK